MSHIEDVLWRLCDEERGAFGASGSPTFIAEALRGALLSDETVERAARTITPHLYWKYDKWDEADEEDRELAREIARGALAAALKETM